jgi:hypothetical protein
MKKSLIALLASALVISSVSAGDYEATTYKEPAYKTAIIDDSLEFEAKRDGSEVYLEWNEYEGDDFKYYKIMRSETHNNPVYPDQHALNYKDDVSDTEYELKDWAQKSVNYRVCVITTENGRICSKVVSLEGMTQEDHKEYSKEKYEYKKEYTKEKVEDKKVYTKEKLKTTKKPNLDTKLAERADKMVDNLVARLEKKHGDDTEKQADRLETIINKLETLNSKIKSENTKALVTYITEGLKEALNELGASDDIEEIFDILEEE